MADGKDQVVESHYHSVWNVSPVRRFFKESSNQEEERRKKTLSRGYTYGDIGVRISFGSFLSVIKDLYLRNARARVFGMLLRPPREYSTIEKSMRYRVPFD